MSCEPFDGELAAAVPRGALVLAGVLLPRLAVGVTPEDARPAQAPWQSALAACEGAAGDVGLSAAERGVALVARAALLIVIDELPALQEAERTLVQAILLLPPDTPAFMARDAHLLLAELLAHVAAQVPEADRDGFIDRGLAVGRAAEFLAADAPEERARALAAQALLLAERFGSVRDRELMNALERAGHALTLLDEAQVRGAVRWAVLQLKMGNAALAIAVQRDTWLREALRHYTLGRGVLDAARYPRLAAAFDANLALWADGGDERLRAELPPPEARARARRTAAQPRIA